MARSARPGIHFPRIRTHDGFRVRRCAAPRNDEIIEFLHPRAPAFFVARERPMLWLNETKKHGEPPMAGARLKHYGWGREGEGMSEDERKFVLGRYHTKFGVHAFEIINVPRLED